MPFWEKVSLKSTIFKREDARHIEIQSSLRSSSSSMKRRRIDVTYLFSYQSTLMPKYSSAFCTADLLFALFEDIHANVRFSFRKMEAESVEIDTLTKEIVSSSGRKSQPSSVGLISHVADSSKCQASRRFRFTATRRSRLTHAVIPLEK